MIKRTIIAVLATLGTLVGLGVAPASAAPNAICSGTLAAGTYKNVTVAPGANCFVGTNVTILGNFRATRSPGSVIVRTDVGRNFMVAGATVRVIFGPKGCRVDPRAGNNLMVRNSRNVAICFATVDNNIVLRNNTGRLMLRDSLACNNIRVVNNDVLGLRVLRNRYEGNFTVARNDVQNVRRVEGNHEFAAASNPAECRRVT